MSVDGLVDIVEAGPSLPKLTDVRPMAGRLVDIRFSDGREKIVDLAPILSSRRLFIPLRNDDARFAQVRISEYGDALEWGDDIDLSASWIDRLPPVNMSNAEFRAIMRDLDLSLDGMAQALELSRRQIANYRSGRPIPRSIAFAMRYLASRLPDTQRGSAR